MEGHKYNGNISVTSHGEPCQHWAAQTPHTHSWTGGPRFPYFSIEDAENFCRYPDEDVKYFTAPWCYTTDPDRRWEYCNVPICEPANTSMLKFVICMNP